MTKFSILASLAVIALLLAIPAVVLAQAQPPRPAVFAGTVSLDGAAAPDGTTVSAWIDGEQVASTTVTGGIYGLTISQPPGGAFAGEEVIFMVGSSESLERGTWEADGGAELNLSASSSMMRRGPVTVAAAWSGLDLHLVDRDGITLYLFSDDTHAAAGETPVSACTSSGCLGAWPPLITEGNPVAMDQSDVLAPAGRVVQDQLGSFERTDDGVTINQATYHGWPLYYYRRDVKPGDVTGQYGPWFVVSPSGNAVVGGTNVDPAGAGSEGPAGPAGPGGGPGPAGPRGADGADGAAGAAGARGASGSAGSSGSAGASGSGGGASAAGSSGSGGGASAAALAASSLAFNRSTVFSRGWALIGLWWAGASKISTWPRNRATRSEGRAPTPIQYLMRSSFNVMRRSSSFGSKGL